jgi:hypothetical protein
VLPKGMQLLRTDPDRRVRAFAAEVSAAGSTRIQTPRPRSSKPVARIRIRRCARRRLGMRRAVPSTARRGQRCQRPRVAWSGRSVDERRALVERIPLRREGRGRLKARAASPLQQGHGANGGLEPQAPREIPEGFRQSDRQEPPSTPTKCPAHTFGSASPLSRWGRMRVSA